MFTLSHLTNCSSSILKTSSTRMLSLNGLRRNSLTPVSQPNSTQTLNMSHTTKKDMLTTSLLDSQLPVLYQLLPAPTNSP